MKPLTPLRAGLRIAGYNILTLVILSIVAEGCVRLFNPEILPLATDSQFVRDSVYASSPGLVAGATGRSMGQQFDVTDDGFWSYTATENVSEYDREGWLFLGDSVTMGMGVNPDSTFAGRLSNRTATLMHVMNPSWIGYSSRDYTNISLALGSAESHNIARITVFWSLNDAYSALSGDDAPVGIRRFVPTLTLFVYRHVRTYQWLKKLIFDRPRVYFEFDKTIYNGNYGGFDSVIDDIVSIKLNADRMGARLEFVLLPYEYQFRSGDRAPQQRMASVFDSLQIRFVDAADAFDHEIIIRGLNDASEFYLFGDGIHFSSKGHGVISDIVAGIN